jgi:hypothetical protein
MQKNYNRLAMQGVQIDDMEFCQQFKLDPSLAYTPKINTAMLDLMYDKNIKGFQSEGYSLDQAKSKAGRLRSEAKADIDRMLSA